MKKIIISCLVIFSLFGCSSKPKIHNKTITCVYEEVVEDVVTYTNITAKYSGNELLAGDLRVEMVYETNSYAKVAYNVYEKLQDEDHKAELILDENKVIMIVNYPNNNNADYFIDQVTKFTLYNACETEIIK